MGIQGRKVWVGVKLEKQWRQNSTFSNPHSTSASATVEELPNIE